MNYCQTLCKGKKIIYSRKIQNNFWLSACFSRKIMISRNLLRGLFLPIRNFASAATSLRPSPMHITDRETLLKSREDSLPPTSRTWYAFYDSSVDSDNGGAIITDPLFFNIPVDDHGFHRGHCVFDTCTVSGSKCFGLDFHLDRFLTSANRAGIEHSYTKEWLRETLLRTIAASKQREDTFVRYWLTSGE